MIANLLIFITSLNNSAIDTAQPPATFIGQAVNFKIGAAVETDSAGVYYVDGLDYWDKSFRFKRVKVTGTVELVKAVPNTWPDSVIVASIIGDRWVIKNAHWELVKKLTRVPVRKKLPAAVQ